MQSILEKRSTEERGVPKDIAGKIGDSVASVFTILVGGGLWWVGAWLTLYCLLAIGIPVDRLGGLAWSIPLGISFVEIKFWPRQVHDFLSYRIVMLGSISLLDLASTFYGAVEWLKGRFFPLYTGISVPTEGAVLLVLAGIGSGIVTFVPERLIVAATKDLMRIWDIKRINLWLFTVEV